MTQTNPRPLRERRRRLFLILTVLASISVAGLSQVPAPKGSLQAYFVDVEGGQATLFVTPTGQSLLIDAGYAGQAGRDADRIVAVAKHAGLAKIDYVLLTHYHGDHAGGVSQLVERIPIGTFLDHGPNREAGIGGRTQKVYDAYQQVLATGKYQHIVLHPDDTLPVSGIKVTVISADGDLINHPLPGGGEANPYCKVSEVKPADEGEDSKSVGVMITFGKLRILDLADLSWDKEFKLMCPSNPLGKVDILVVSHHGWDRSSSPALIDAVQAKVAIINNAAAKGGTPSVLDTIAKAPRLEGSWQLHYSEEGGAAHNPPDEYIANLQGPDAGHYLEITASPDGNLSIFNSRTGFTRKMRLIH
jgi:beta-lactamase superfamily II metal-dependent hydrolase